MCDDLDLLDAVPCSDKVTDEQSEPEQSSSNQNLMKIKFYHDEGKYSFPQVANVIVLMYKMKVQAKEDTVYDRPCCQSKVTAQCGNMVGIFKQHGSKVECQLCDYNKKILVRKNSQELQLQAIHLKEYMDYKTVTFYQEKYVSSRARGKMAVILGIAGSDNFLSCTWPPGSETPVLKLETANCEQLKSIEANGEKARFLFYRRTVAFSNITFESVRFPGWLIRSSLAEHSPVEMCMKDSATNLYMFEEQCVNTP